MGEGDGGDPRPFRRITQVLQGDEARVQAVFYVMEE